MSTLAEAIAAAAQRKVEMQVQASVTKEDGWKRTVAITVPAAEIETVYVATTAKFRQKAKIPGFRPGKAPEAMILQRHAADIRQDVLEAVVPDAFDAALKQLTLDPIGSPTLSAVQLERGSDLTFEAEIEIRPQVDIVGYKGLKLTKQVYEVTDQDVDSALESVRDGAATTTEVQRPAREGDVVTCDLQKIYDRLNRVKRSQFNDIRIELRNDRTRPQLFAGLNGMAVGEGKEIEVTYPADEPDPDLAGNTLLYRVWLKSVAQKNLPVLDDAFARSLAGSSVETLAQLRDVIRKDLERRMEGAAMKDLRAQARRGVVEANQFPIPGNFLQEYLDDVANRLKAQDPSITPDTVRGRFEPLAVEQFRWDYAVSDIAKRENINVTGAEVDAIIEAWPPGAQDRPDKEKVHWSLLEMKIYDFLLTNAEISESRYNPAAQIIRP